MDGRRQRCVCVHGDGLLTTTGSESKEAALTVSLPEGVPPAGPDRRTQQLGETAAQIGNHGDLVRV